MVGESEAAELIRSWGEQVSRCSKLRFVLVVRMEFDLGWNLPFSLFLGPVHAEACFHNETGKIKGMYKGLEETAVWRDDGFFVFSGGRWVRSLRAPVTVERLKRLFFGLDAINEASHFSMREGELEGQPVWVIEGLVSKGDEIRKTIWWITQEDRALTMLEQVGRSTFSWKGKVTETPLPTMNIKFAKIEFPTDLPCDLITVPEDTPTVETIPADPFVKWLEELAGRAQLDSSPS